MVQGAQAAEGGLQSAVAWWGPRGSLGQHAVHGASGQPGAACGPLGKQMPALETPVP
jgi:hypothetical protein